ncbi:MAG: acyl-CoA dehydrogenase [Burkholderiales bacterium 66-5]|nr:MAG: acyl-CoA dehydrogenase [Burkholderiales bacterium 66-5]
MADYDPSTGDRVFLLEQVLHASAQWRALPPFADADAPLAAQVLEEAGKFVAEVIAPLNRVGDEVGARWHAGVVTMPPGFADAYRQFWQGGWPALASDPAHGGQGLPAVLEAQLYEMLSGANHGWTMAPGLLHGAYECLRHHGSEPLKAQYLEKIATGEWLATMCLTEPQAGSDLGLVSTRALPQADGSHLISGSKIFISGGEHDLTDNIVHLVLAREPGAPAGPKGLSLFLVPKFYADGTRSAVSCEGIEEKMGLHGSPTCAMRLDAARGWIVGAPGRGLAAMFVMMNAARLHVALQGLGLLDAAWQKADAYARERRQMRAPGASSTSLLIEHPAMRRILDTQRAWIDAGRVLAYQTALELDIARHHPDAARRAQAERWCALTTPVMKAAFTHQAFHGGSDCLQVFGGHGYVRESGIEQHVRDARVAMIYEGTNEIQAIDLLARKVLADGGEGWCALLQSLAQPLGETALAALARAHLQALRALTLELAAACRADAALPYEVADDYLRAAAVALLCWAGTRIEEAAGTSCDEPNRWQAPLQALQRWIAPELPMRCAIIRNRLPATAP